MGRPPAPGQTNWSKALVRHGADLGVAFAEVLGVSAGGHSGEGPPSRRTPDGSCLPEGDVWLRPTNGNNGWIPALGTWGFHRPLSDSSTDEVEGRQHQTALSMAATMRWVRLRAKGIAT
jgi:hypothetical protein